MEIASFLWDGNKQLPGILKISDSELTFVCSDFKDSHLHLIIQIRDIEKLELCAIYRLAINGLKIKTSQKKEDVFVLEDPQKIRNTIIDLLKKKKGYS